MERKCAIYNRISMGTQEELTERRAKLIDYCINTLKIKDITVFEEIASVLHKREEFDDMIKKIHNNEYTDLLVEHPDRLYKATYNKKIFDDIVVDIASCGVELHSMKVDFIINVEEMMD